MQQDMFENFLSRKTGHLNMKHQYCLMQDGAFTHRTADVFTRQETKFYDRLIAVDAEKFKDRVSPIHIWPQSIKLFIKELHQGHTVKKSP